MRLEAQLLDGDYQPTVERQSRAKQESVSISQVADDFIAFKKTERRRRKTVGKYRSTMNVFQKFCATQEITLIENVTLRAFDKYRESRLKIRSLKTVNNESVILKSILDWCVQRKLILENPLKDQVFRTPRYVPKGGPTLEQVNLVLGKFHGQKRLALEILAFTGMRAGECQRLRWDLGDLDFEENWIHIVSRDGGGETKTGNTWKVPIHPRLKKSLVTLPRSKRMWFLNSPASRKYPNGGHWLNMKKLNEEFQEVLKTLGIASGKKKGGFYLHSLRAFFKTFCIDNNVPQKIVDIWQNHSDGQRPTASDQYYRLSDEVSQAKMKTVPFGDG